MTLVVYLDLLAAVGDSNLLRPFCQSPSFLTPHFSLWSFTVQLFLVPLPATRLSHYVCIPSCPSVVSFRLFVCVCQSAFLLPRLVICLHYVYVSLISKSVKCVRYSLIFLII